MGFVDYYFTSEAQVICVYGIINRENAERVFRDIEHAVERAVPPRVLIDLAGAKNIDENGVILFESLSRRYSEDGDFLTLCRPDGMIRDLLVRNGLDRFSVIDEVPLRGGTAAASGR